jgi:DMSO/TMAO reductase YedYZ molybdopterin-dependent catalytic subunit
MRSSRTAWGIVAGLLAGAAAIAVAQLAAGLTGPVGSPVVDVGQAAIDLSPPAVKDFAISTFGPHDKVVLVTGILVVLGIFAAVAGAVAMRRLWLGLAAVALFGAVGVAAAVTRPAAAPADVLPTLLGMAAAAAALALLVRAAPRGRAHAADPVPATARADGPERRRFLITGVVTAGAAATAGIGGRLLAERTSVARAQSALRFPAPARPAPRLPAGTDLRIPGLSSFVTPNSSFYRVDTAIVLPEVPPGSWGLRVHGMVRREVSISFAELLRRPLIADYITLTCVSDPVSGPYVGNALWLGASLASVLREAGILAGANQLLCTSVDGFTSGTPVQTVMDGRDALLAVAMNGTALPVEHGFPVRMVVPGLYGYVSACKWLTDIEVTTFDRSVAYWAQRGWAPMGPIKTESRIDVPTGEAALRPGRIPVAGVAWAQHKGIDAVEVRVDRGPWSPARLAAVPDIDCWRQWVWYWDARPGRHLIEARATDATGYTQTALTAPPAPNGASGYPSVQVTVLG